MSSKAILLPAINRGTSRTVAQSLTGIIAYGSRSNIYFVDIKNVPPTCLDSRFLHEAHKGKINVVSFCKCDGPELLASCSEDGELKVWDFESSSCLKTVDMKDFCAVEWVYGNRDLLVYASEGKFVVKWNLKFGTSVKIKTAGDFFITTIISNEYNSELIAAGHLNGFISVINIVQEKLLYKLKAHSMEITDLSWKHDSLDALLSFSLDATVRVWKLGEDSPVFTYYSPCSKKVDDKNVQRMMGMFHPTKQNVIICSTIRGEIGEIAIKEKNPKFTSYLMKNTDMNLRFVIALLCCPKKAYLYSIDSFKISKYDISKKEMVTRFPFVLGFVYDLCLSKHNPNLLAICNGDGFLRVYDGGSQQSGRLNIASIYIQKKTKIMTAAWHPELENIIAYGTDEGRVGVADIYKKKSLYSFETHHTDVVYSLTWGTCSKIHKESDASKLYLYSCGGGIVYINQEGTYKCRALNFDDLIDKPEEYKDSQNCYSELCWNANFTLFCVGNFKGFIEIYDGDLVFLGRLIVPLKIVESLRFHPDTTYMSPSGSPLKSWLACSGSEAEIYIFDIAEISMKIPDVFMNRPVKKLVGHKRRIASVSWSEHSDGFLASASKDGSSMVWNVCTQTLIATFLSHSELVFAVQWSMTDKDVIYSGGQDGSVRVWNISHESAKPVPDKIPVRRKLKKMRQENQVAVLKKDVPVDYSACDEPHLNNSDAKVKKQFSVICDEIVSTEKEPLKEEDDNKVPKKKKSFRNEYKLFGLGIKKSLVFPMHSFKEGSLKIDELEDCMKLADIVSRKQKPLHSDESFESLKKCALSDEDVLKFGLYTDQLTALRMLDVQSGNFRSENNSTSAYELALFAGNVQPVLKDAAEKGNLSTFLVSLAPTVSHNFWLEMCEKFANQLIDSQQYHKACMYYMLCGKIHDAVNLLADKGNVIDAIALAKSRLPETDPIIKKLFRCLEKKYSLLKNYIGEALCSIGSKDPVRAAKILSASADPNATRAAAYICRKFDLDKEANEYLFLCLERCLMKCDWASFKKLALREPFLQVYEALVCVHEAFYQHIRYLKTRDGILLPGIFNVKKFGPKVKFWSGVTSEDSQQSFIHYLKNLLLSKGLLSGEKFSLPDLCDALRMLKDKRASLEISSEAHISIAINMTEYILLSLLEDAAAKRALLNIFEASYNIAFLSRTICLLFFPIDLYWHEETKSFSYEILAVQDDSENSLLNFQTIYKTIGKTIAIKTQPLELPLIDKEDLKYNLSATAIKIRDILSSKTTEEFLLFYFVSSITHDLKKLTEKKKLSLGCSVTGVFDQDVEKEIKSFYESKTTVNGNENPNSLFSPSVELINRDNKIHNSLQSTREIISYADIFEVHSDVNENLSVQVDKDVRSIAVKENLSCGVTNRELSSTDINEELLINDVDDEVSASICEDVFIADIGEETGLIKDTSDSRNDIIDEELTGCVNNDVSIGDVANQVFIENDEQLRNLIEMLIKEADSKAQTLRESKEKAISETGEQFVETCDENILYCVEANVNGSYSLTDNENCENNQVSDVPIKAFECDISDHCDQTHPLNSPFNQKLDEKLHEPCVRHIDLFCNIVTLIAFNVCKDEYALLYHLRERLNVLNNLMSSAVLSQISKETTKNAFSFPPKKSHNKIIKKSESLKQANLTQVTSDVDNASRNDNDLELKNYPEKEPLVNSGEIVENKNNFTESLNIHENRIQDLDQKTNSEQTHMGCSPSQDSNETCNSEDKTLMEATVMNHVDHNYSVPLDCPRPASDIFEVNVIQFPSETSSTESLQQEHKMISEIICCLSENLKDLSYPSPFDAVAKLCEVTCDVMHNSKCIAVQNKLHNLLHDIINWSEKFNVGEINFLCQICLSLN